MAGPVMSAISDTSPAVHRLAHGRRVEGWFLARGSFGGRYNGRTSKGARYEVDGVPNVKRRNVRSGDFGRCGATRWFGRWRRDDAGGSLRRGRAGTFTCTRSPRAIGEWRAPGSGNPAAARAMRVPTWQDRG